MKEVYFNNERGNTVNKIHDIQGVVVMIKRLKSSYFGNPRHQVKIDGVIFETGVDASLGYSIDNYRGRLVNAKVKYLKSKNVVLSVEQVFIG